MASPRDSASNLPGRRARFPPPPPAGLALLFRICVQIDSSAPSSASTLVDAGVVDDERRTEREGRLADRAWDDPAGQHPVPNCGRGDPRREAHCPHCPITSYLGDFVVVRERAKPGLQALPDLRGALEQPLTSGDVKGDEPSRTHGGMAAVRVPMAEYQPRVSPRPAGTPRPPRSPAPITAAISWPRSANSRCAVPSPLPPSRCRSGTLVRR